MSDKIEVENVNHPGHVTRVDAVKYAAAKTALLAILSGQEQGLTQTEMMAAIKVQIDQTLFPNGAKSGWWMKTVQLDLEAKGKIIRIIGKPPSLDIGMNLPVQTCDLTSGANPFLTAGHNNTDYYRDASTQHPFRDDPEQCANHLRK